MSSLTVQLADELVRVTRRAGTLVVELTPRGAEMVSDTVPVSGTC